ncbi:MAG TPA: 2-oxo acid dehydrogenase subunit E2, partial [Ottowia sp.]|nr:2-oxo acid dehydrogenase subunit E2 [Ottowia sp.]
MGTYVIRVPDIGEGIAEVELVAWHVQPGDAVSEDQHLADVMTDKATVEVPSPVAGKVLTLGGGVGQVMAVGAELVRLDVEGAGNFKENEASAPAPSAPAAPVSIATEVIAQAPDAAPRAPAAAAARGSVAAPRPVAG